MRRLVLSLLTLASASRALAADDVAFFESRIRPLLIEKCLDCHSASTKLKGGLSLDHRDTLLRGGDTGPAIVPGDPDRSRLIEAVRYHNRDLQMPPKGALTASQVRDLETWIQNGAPDPRPPPTQTPHTKQTGLSLEQGRQFWSFQPLADPALPPVQNTAWPRTPVDTFILAELEKNHLSPAPPADRHTLIRRATFDLTGLPPTPAEITTFLADDSPDAFRHLIDRLLASPQYGARWARHWLDVARYADSNGMDENVAYGHAWRYRDYVVRAFNDDKPYDQFLIEQLAGDLLPAHEQTSREDALAATGFLSLGAKILAEADRQKQELDIIDEQLDTLGKAFLGMTFGCARCHDHKFDPVTTADYYALAAIFRSTRSLADEKLGAIKFWYEHSQATPEQLEAKKQHEQAVKAQAAKIAKHSKETRAKLKTELHTHAADYLAAAAQLPADPDFAQVEKLAARLHLRPRYLLTCRLYLARHPDHPLFTRWHDLVASNQLPELRQHYTSLFQKPAGPALDALQDAAGFLAIPDKDADAFDGEMLMASEQMKTELMALEDLTPDPPAFMGVADGTITPAMPIHIRGSYLTLGPPIARGFPAVMRTSLTKPVFPAKQSGRLDLARWLASSEHPLTARVAVNRLWRWHFGRGLVASTENFGVLGDRPSHPALLDWLARAFIENGWSLKDMHRLLMNSAVYQQSSDTPSTQPPQHPDPENKLLSRMNRQRLEAEQLRDSLLAVSGSLDLQLGGKTLPLRNREFVFNHTSKDNTTYESPRRALYLPIIRNHLNDILEQFDYPDPTMPTGSRNATVVAPQALLMLNSPFVMDCAARLASHLQQSSPTDAQRYHLATTLLYSRPATPTETTRALHWLTTQPNPSQAWTQLCHTLLATNEFLYLR